MLKSFVFSSVVVLSAVGCQQRSETEVASTRPPAPGLPPVVATPKDAGVTPPAPAAPVDDHTEVNARIQTVLGEPAKYEQVFASLQQAVKAHDARAVAALVAYPFTTPIAGKKVKLAGAPDFVKHYDAIVTPAIADTITGQRYSALFVNAKGVMFGDGEVWLNGICKDKACKDADVRVVAIQPVK
jgi:hypothetical protein